MPTTPGSVKVAPVGSLLPLIILTCFVWVLRGYVWPILSNTEVDALRAMLDPTLFQRDFSVQECLHFSPRYYYNELILLPARIGLPLEWAFVFWQLIAIGTLLSGLRALAKCVGLGEISTAVLILWLLTVSVGTLGSVYFYTHAPVPAVWAGAIVAWGAAWAWRGRWLMAFACFGAAALLQFLVGFYAGILALPALLWSRRLRGVPLVTPWLIGLAMVYLPMALSGSPSSTPHDNGDLVYIYAQLRAPHHLLPSTWGWPYWIQAIAFYAGAGWFIHRTKTTRPPKEQAVVLTTIGLAVATLLLNYLFVEVYPSALVAKLQPARITPLAQAVVLLILATRVHLKFVKRDWVSAIGLCLIPFCSFPGALLVLAAVLESPTGERSPLVWPKYVLALAIILAFQPFGTSIIYRFPRYSLWAAIVFAQLLTMGLVRRPTLLACYAILTVASTVTLTYWSWTSTGPLTLSGHFSINAPPTDGPGILGQRFEKQSEKNALVLVPPTSESWSFKLYAKRAVIVDDKNTPFTDNGLREWRLRMDAILGRNLNPGLDAEAAWRQHSVNSIVATATRYGARYLLTKDDSHPDFPGRAIDRASGWTIWDLSGVDAAPISQENKSSSP